MQGDWFHSEFWPVYPRKVDKAEALKAAQQKLVGIVPPPFDRRPMHGIAQERDAGVVELDIGRARYRQRR